MWCAPVDPVLERRKLENRPTFEARSSKATSQDPVSTNGSGGGDKGVTFIQVLMVHHPSFHSDIRSHGADQETHYSNRRFLVLLGPTAAFKIPPRVLIFTYGLAY